MPNLAVTILAFLSVILIGLMIVRPSLTNAQGGKIFAFIGLFNLPIIATGLGAAIHLENSKSTQFCLSCHVMENHEKAFTSTIPVIFLLRIFRIIGFQGSTLDLPAIPTSPWPKSVA